MQSPQARRHDGALAIPGLAGVVLCGGRSARMGVDKATITFEGTTLLERALADGLYADLGAAGLEVLYDDRDAGPGEKFTDAELLGCPLRVTIGRKTLAAGEVEVQIRRGREAAAVPIENAAAALDELWRGLP